MTDNAEEPGSEQTPLAELKEGRDYYREGNGLIVFTSDFLLRRGFCCENGCRHCPYGYSPLKTKRT